MEGSAAVREEKKTPQDIRMQPSLPVHTLLTKLNDLRRVLDRSVPTYALLNTRQGRRDRDELLHFVLLRPHDTT
jgi:hypothetical protein